MYVLCSSIGSKTVVTVHNTEYTSFTKTLPAVVIMTCCIRINKCMHSHSGPCYAAPVIQVAPLVVASGTSAVTTTVTAALTATMTPMLGTPKLQTAVTTGGVTNTQQQQQQVCMRAL